MKLTMLDRLFGIFLIVISTIVMLAITRDVLMHKDYFTFILMFVGWFGIMMIIYCEIFS